MREYIRQARPGALVNSARVASGVAGYVPGTGVGCGRAGGEIEFSDGRRLIDAG